MRIITTITIIYFILTSSFAYSQWEQTNGPFGGTPRCFAVDGSNVFMGTNYNGGFYSSSNNGVSWNRIYNSLSEYNFYSLIFTTSNLFAGTQFGVYKSTNFGTNWTFSGLSNQIVWSLAFSGINIFAGTSGNGIYLSTNNGSNWNAINNGLTNLDVRTISISGTNVYAGTYGGGIFKSTNNGNNWTIVNNGITNLNLITSTNLGSNVFIGTQGTMGGVFKTTNNGSNWTIVNNGLLNTNIYALTVSQGNLFAGTQGGGVYKSTNNGLNWFYSNSGLTSAYVWSFETSGGNLIAGCFDAGGCFYSTNNGSNWLSANNGLLNQNVTSLKEYNSILFAGTNRDGIFKSSNNGFSWQNSSNGLPNAFIYAIEKLGTTIFAGISAQGGIYKSTDNGLNWIVSNSGLTNQTVLVLQAVGSNIFAGTYGGGLFISTNNGLNWNSVSSGITNNNVWDLTSSGNSIFCATENGIFRSSNNGTNWITVNNGLSNTDVRSITSSGSNIIAGSYGSGIFLSSNNGNNWSIVNAGIPYVWSFGASGSNIFAGTQTGVYWSSNSGLVWSNYNQTFPSRVINSLLVSNNFVFAGTQGSSVWRRSISGVLATVDYPSPYLKLISGNTDTIKWSNLIWQTVNIKCFLNAGTSQESIITLSTNFQNSQQYIWDIPDTLLSYRSKIVIENAVNPSQKIESDIFRIKPYLLTRVDIVNNDSIYYEYRKNRDQWGFWNEENQMFPPIWYQQFNYQGIDPFTGITYPQWQGFFTFKNAKSKNFTDWISWVNTFTTNECYWNTTLGIYKLFNLLKWRFSKDTCWKGSCFGLAISNGLIFRNKAEFLNKYINFPNFSNPINVTSNNSVKKVINELFTHQFGEPHKSYRQNIGYNKSPTQTVNEIKTMLLSESDSVRTLSFYKNLQRTAGHAVLPYRIKPSINNPFVYSVYVYDNAFPFSNNPIIVNTVDSNGNGTWLNNDWSWYGDRNFFLEESVQTYLNNPTDAESINTINGLNNVQILNSKNYSYIIRDTAGNISGYVNDSLKLNIANSYPLIYLNSSEGPPYGFELPNANYSIELKNFLEDTIQTPFFAGNDAFLYERFNASFSQTDKLYYDGGLSVSNPNSELKVISLLNLQSEATHEKLFSFSSLEMTQNDSLKIENLGSENFKLISYGSTKNYDIELNYSSQTALTRFVNINIDLPPNSSHTCLPDWNNLSNSQLVILEDIGNNGTIDDTLRIKNIFTNTEGGLLSIPDKYSLSQNYPNPFNPSTIIKYDVKNDGMVTLKVYNILGEETATLVNEIKRAGKYEVEFSGSNLSSGIYYYRLEAGKFSETRKMLLLK